MLLSPFFACFHSTEKTLLLQYLQKAGVTTPALTIIILDVLVQQTQS
jgi:hypothetical protein